MSARERTGEPRHALRVTVIWAIVSAIATPLIYYVLGPHLPPGGMSDAAAGQRWDIQVMSTIATPVMLFVIIWIGYSVFAFRQRGPEIADGPPLRGNVRLQFAWIAATTVIVMFLFGFGTYELIVPNGAGAGEGPNPIWKPAVAASKLLQVQAIGQQWRWTYRWPQYGGIETTSIELPLGQEVQVNVTSLDVIHSWWAIQLGVKADANPSLNNVAYFRPLQLGSFTVRCAELCGIWHGAMFNYGRIVTPAQFRTWITQQMAAEKSLLPYLPKYATTYTPDECGGGGSNYPPQDEKYLPSYNPGGKTCGK
jgi:cytochrome c oxidase subunit 2